MHRPIGRSPLKILIKGKLILQCSLKFGCVLDERLTEEDYITNFQRKVNNRDDRALTDIEKTSYRIDDE